jgi:hypothetical protein
LINVGNVGLPNYYERHKGSAQCTKNKKKWKEADVVNRTKSLAMSFFGPRPPKVPSTVTNPSCIQTTSFIPLTGTPTTGQIDRLNLSTPHTSKPTRGCPIALQLLASLKQRIDSLPRNTKEASGDHPLARFSGDPVGSVEDGEDAWEKWDSPLNTLLQKDPEELDKLVVIGPRGLAGFHCFLSYLVSEHGVQGCLLEDKMERLFSAIDRV